MKCDCEIINRSSFLLEAGKHPLDTFLIVLDGVFTCCVSGKSYEVGQNDIFVFNKSSIFERKVLKPIKCIYVQFDSFPIKLKSGILKISDTFRVDNTIRYLETAVSKNENSLIKHFINDIFVMYRSFEVTKANDDVVEGCIRYMKENYRQKINLDTLADIFSVSKQTLITRFKNHTKETPMKYLNAIRVNKCKKLLTDTSLYSYEIAEKCGFDNVYYFSNVFKQFTEYSPSEYRRKFKL